MKQEAAPEGLCLLFGWAELAQTMPFNRTHGSLELFFTQQNHLHDTFSATRELCFPDPSTDRHFMQSHTVRCCCGERLQFAEHQHSTALFFLSKDTAYRTSQKRLVTGFVPAIGTRLPTSLVIRGQDRLGSWNSVRHRMADSRQKTGTQRLDRKSVV